MPAVPPPSVLVVDDAVPLREQLSSALDDAGFATTQAGDLRTARKLLRDADFDAVVLDLMLPDGEGTELLGGDGPPVIMLTASGHPELVAVALQAGAHDFVHKPFEPVEVIARVGAAVRTKRLADELRAANARLEVEARTDVLTGLLNRRYATLELERLLSGAARHGRQLSVLVLDVDHFKDLNDARGHHAGDDVLRAMATQLGGALRAGDVLSRWGGEEFVALLPDTGAAGAAAVAERMRAGTAQAMPVTISVGCATWRAGESSEDLLARADAALYEAKRAGRNRVAV